MWKACAVCGYPLEKLGEDWLHARDLYSAQDHLVVPVDANEVDVNGRCDFCNREPVTEVLWCTPFYMPLPGPPQRSVGHWAICADCAPLVRRRRWSQLITRVRRVGPARTSRRTLEVLYAAVELHAIEQITVAEWKTRADRYGPFEDE